MVLDRRTLELSLISAKKLRNPGRLGGKMSLYVKATIDGTVQKVYSPIVKVDAAGQAARWNHHMVLTVIKGEDEDVVFKVKKVGMLFNSTIGVARIHMEPIMADAALPDNGNSVDLAILPIVIKNPTNNSEDGELRLGYIIGAKKPSTETKPDSGGGSSSDDRCPFIRRFFMDLYRKAPKGMKDMVKDTIKK